jgi:hypothetical protein
MSVAASWLRKDIGGARLAPAALAAAMFAAAASEGLSHCVCGASAAMQWLGPQESGGGIMPSVALANTRFCDENIIHDAEQSIRLAGPALHCEHR